MLTLFKSLRRLKDEKLFLALLILLFAFISLHVDLSNMWKSVDWNTITSLTGLLIVSTAIKESGLFAKISLRMAKHLHSERTLAVFLVTISAIFSMFLTNDITLFIVVPLTLSLQDFLANDVKKLVIFEALAVNVGSTLSPIGNPQNLFLWHEWNVSFFDFIVRLLPLEISMMALFFLFTLFVFKKKALMLTAKNVRKVDFNLALISTIALIVYVTCMQFGWEEFVVAPLFIFYFFYKRSALKKVDWFLLATFILMFLDVHFLTQFESVKTLVKSLNVSTTQRTFLFSLLSSQMMSNVPAAIFVSKFSKAYLAIVYGVNIGGNGIVIGSLANLIALRMAKSKGIYTKFHVYSFPYFFLSAFLGYFMLNFVF